MVPHHLSPRRRVSAGSRPRRAMGIPKATSRSRLAIDAGALAADLIELREPGGVRQKPIHADSLVDGKRSAPPAACAGGALDSAQSQLAICSEEAFPIHARAHARTRE